MALTKAENLEKHTSSCPWGNLPTIAQAPSSFSSLMDEEYAKQIEEEVNLGASEKQEKRDFNLLNEGILCL